jgi:uncharacterized membrane protein HdeD (DUF308 family)
MDMIIDRWWVLLLRGAAAIVFGVLTLIAPLASLFALVILFGAYALVDGALYLTLALRGAKHDERWGSFVVAGVASLAAGVITFSRPGVSAVALLFLIAGWAVVTGVAAITAAVRLRRYIQGEWLLALSGLLSLAFGVLIAIFPRTGALVLASWIGAYAIVSGGVLAALALRLYARRNLPGHGAPQGTLPTAA